MYTRFAAALLLLSAAAAQAGEIPGPKAKLRIVRDRDGVPHIRARSEADALFGLGFVHAQDRLWQLEFLRRLGRGRLAEVLGPSALDRDRMFRTLGIAQSAAATWAHYPPGYRPLIESYVAGLNAATEQQRRTGLPPEFGILNIEPEPWSTEDVLVFAKVLGWSVDRNWNQELLRMQLVQKVGEARAAELMPAYTREGPIVLPQNDGTSEPDEQRYAAHAPVIDARFLSELTYLEQRVADSTGLAGGPGIGSNNQVLAGVRTTTGKPILAADPHLPSQIPAIFYRAHVTGGRLDAIGATVVGLPGIVMGHNGRIAWGWTNANADVQDLYIERIHNGLEAEYNGTREPLQIRNEIIRVKGAADVVLTVRSTRHGPLVSDLIDPNGPALALRWVALDDDDDVGIAAYLTANRATDRQEFTDAFRRFKAHSQNLLYADTHGNIGYILAGTIPVRASGDGTVPVPGWTPQFEWTGYIPFDELPASLNPRQGYIASSNNRIAPPSYPYTIGSSFAAPYRAARVHELLSERSRFRPDDLEDVQADVLAVHARELMPVLARVQPAGDMERRALDLLTRWDLRMTPESAAAAVFEAWYIQIAETLFADELGDALWRAYSEQLHMVSMAASAAVRTGSAWCDDVRTAVRENCDTAASSAFTLAMQRMAAAQQTNDPAAWQWSRVHRTVFFHAPFDADPELSKRFNRTVPNGGDKHTVNVASNPRWSDYDQRHIALYRQIIDLADITQSRWMAAPGQSGILTDSHYDDLIEDWRRVAYRRMPYTKKAIEEEAVERLELRP